MNVMSKLSMLIFNNLFSDLANALFSLVKIELLSLWVKSDEQYSKFGIIKILNNMVRKFEENIFRFLDKMNVIVYFRA